MVKNLPANAGILSPGWEDPLEEGTATHSSILAQKIPTDKRARLLIAALSLVAELGLWSMQVLQYLYGGFVAPGHMESSRTRD